MIYELCTYDLIPHSVPEVERRLGAAFEERRKLSELAGSFRTEIGPLNEVTQLWAYENVDERDRVARAVAANETAQADIADFVVGERSEIFVPFAFSPEIAPGDPGPFFEMRTYVYADGELPKVSAAWEAALPGRLAFSQPVGVLHSGIGGVNTLLHIWAYKSLDERMKVRKDARDTGLWPPLEFARKHGMPEYRLERMQNKIMIASDFSPLR